MNDENIDEQSKGGLILELVARMNDLSDANAELTSLRSRLAEVESNHRRFRSYGKDRLISLVDSLLRQNTKLKRYYNESANTVVELMEELATAQAQLRRKDEAIAVFLNRSHAPATQAEGELRLDLKAALADGKEGGR